MMYDTTICFHLILLNMFVTNMCEMYPPVQVEAKKKELRRLFTVMGYLWRYSYYFYYVWLSYLPLVRNLG